MSKFIICLFLLIGLSSCELKFNVKEDTEIDVAEGNDFTITLKGNPTTGYIWILSNTDEIKDYLKATNVDKENSGEYITDNHDPTIDGVGGTFYFKFKALKADKKAHQLKFNYLRPWEEDKNGINEITVDVNISSK